MPEGIRLLGKDSLFLARTHFEKANCLSQPLPNDDLARCQGRLDNQGNKEWQHLAGLTAKSYVCCQALPCCQISGPFLKNICPTSMVQYQTMASPSVFLIAAVYLCTSMVDEYVLSFQKSWSVMFLADLRYSCTNLWSTLRFIIPGKLCLLFATTMLINLNRKEE